MPAQIVLVHDEHDFLAEATESLVQAGYTVMAFLAPLDALRAIEGPGRVDLLVTRMRYGPQQPNGISLALMAQRQQSGIKVLFTAAPDVAEHADGLGNVLVAPFMMPDLLSAVSRTLQADALG